MIRLTVYFFLFGSCICQTRKISSVVNPGCSSKCKLDKNVLVHVTAEGAEDTLHHVWDFTNKPSVMLAVTPPNTSLLISWDDFLKGDAGSIKFSSQPSYTFSFVFDQIIEFNDIDNTAVYDPKKYNTSDIKVYDPRKFEWKFKSNSYLNTSKNVFAIMEGEHGGHKGLVRVSLSAYGTMEHSKTQPHLLHTINATQVDIVLKDFQSTKHFKSRFALIFTVVSSDSSQSKYSPISWKNLDDEHSPGVFTVGGYKSNEGYLEWRAVAYTTAERLMTSSTDVTTSLGNARKDSLERTAVYSLFGDQLNRMLISSVILSFGQPGEAFYSATSYLSWTFLGGIGSPVDEGFSLLVLLIISVGIGLPALLIIVGTTCIVVKRMSKKTQGIVFSES